MNKSMVVRSSAAMAPVFPYKTRGEHHGLFRLFCGTAVAALLLFAPPSETSTFVGIVEPFSALKPRSATRDESSSFDVEPEPFEAEPASASRSKMSDMISVFDGRGGQFVTKKFEGKSYTVDVEDWTYTVELKDGSMSRGKWNKDWEMPQFIFERREPALRRAWKNRMRKLRIKHGKGQVRRNGRA